ncbi:MAG TPA: DUF2314 domain-containing protein [Planctomycetota bacterium]|nr:DUF2314 domain-containing protein [Planctomycetota bacterium]
MKLHAALLAVVCSQLAMAADDPAVTDYDAKKMDAAIQRARDEVDKFVAVITKEKVDSFSVKVQIKDGKDGEHFWLSDVKFADGKFSGKLNNTPGIVKNVKFGDPVTVEKQEITDWLYMRGRKMFGNYTLRVLMERMSDKEKEKMAKLFELAE